MPDRYGPPPCQIAGCTADAHVRTSYRRCLEHDEGPMVAPRQLATTGLATDEFVFFFGASCGSSRKTLRQLEEPNVCLSYATADNRPWEAIETLLVDSGGYSLLVNGEGTYPDTIDTYLDYVGEHEPAWFVTRDVPVVDPVLSVIDGDASTAIARTVELTAATLDQASDRGIDAAPMAVLQGQTPQDYVHCYDELAQRGLVTDRLAVGSLQTRSPATVARIIAVLDESLPSRVELHGLGVELPELEHDIARKRLSAADSSRYIATARWRGNRDEHPPRLRDDEPQSGWHETARAYLEMRAELRECLDRDLGDADTPTQLTIDATVE